MDRSINQNKFSFLVSVCSDFKYASLCLHILTYLNSNLTKSSFWLVFLLWKLCLLTIFLQVKIIHFSSSNLEPPVTGRPRASSLPFPEIVCRYSNRDVMNIVVGFSICFCDKKHNMRAALLTNF